MISYVSLLGVYATLPYAFHKWVEPQRTRFSAQEIVTHFPELPIHFVEQHTIIATVLTLFAYYIHTSRSCANREPSFT